MASNIVDYNLFMALNIRNLTSVSAQLSLQACHIINKTHLNQKTVTYKKGDDDLVTQTDFHIQTLLSRGIRQLFPSLQVIGEETQDYEGDIDFNFNSLKADILPKTSKISQNFATEDLCLWIDPIDCTWGFVNGNVQDVTVLIGVTYKGVPILGVIGTPFKLFKGQKVFDPVVTVGSVVAGEAYDYNGIVWSQKRAPSRSENFRLVTGNFMSKKEENYVSGLGAMNIKAGGSGRKIMMVANGQAEATMFLQPYTHKWDSCAGEAIIKSLGGRFTTPFNKSINYSPSRSCTKNEDGMIVTMNHDLHEKCVGAFAEHRAESLL